MEKMHFGKSILQGIFSSRSACLVSWRFWETDLSLAPKLLEQLYGNIHYQIFYGIVINPLHPDVGPVSVTRKDRIFLTW